MDNWDHEKPEYLYQNDRHNSKEVGPLTWLTLFLIISLAVTAGNLFSRYITVRIVEHKLEQLTKTIEAEAQSKAELAKAALLATMKATNERTQQLREAQFEAYRVEELTKRKEQLRIEKMNSADRKILETCNFWINEYKRDKSEFSKSHRDVACREAGKPFNN